MEQQKLKIAKDILCSLLMSRIINSETQVEYAVKTAVYLTNELFKQLNEDE